MNWYLKVLKQYADFNGRARRKEYWMFALFSMIFSFALSFLSMSLGLYDEDAGYGVLDSIYSLAVLIPGLAVSIRRLHDVGKSGWMFLLVFLPIIGWIWLFVLTVTDSDSSENQYGQNPKEVTV